LIPADERGGEGKKEKVREKEENAAARTDEVPGYPLEYRMPPVPGLHIHEAVAAERMTVNRL
jgi:hypothetical protein